MPFTDIAAESGILAGIFNHGLDAFVDVDDFVDPGMLSDSLNQYLLTICKEHYKDGVDKILDWPTLMGHARRLGLDKHLDTEDAKKHYGSLKRFDISLDSIRSQAAKILKMRSAYELDQRLAKSRRKLHELTGEETLAEILAMVENPIHDFSSSFDGGREGGAKLVGEGLLEWLENVTSNPVDNIGIPSPFAEWNEQTGGIHMKAVTLVGAQAKTGKSIEVVVEALHLAGVLGIPVLIVDKEMSEDQIRPRLLASLTGIESRSIAKGRINAKEMQELYNAVVKVEGMPLYYVAAAEMSFEQQIAFMRRWCIKHVPVGEDGKRENSVIFYDYLEVCDEGDVDKHTSESQRLGFMMMSLIRLAVKMPTAIKSMIQLNRAGDVFGSHRPVMKCVSFTILREKTPDEIADDGEENGTHLLDVKHARFGEGSHGNHINLKFDKKTARMWEVSTNYEVRKLKGERKSTEQKFDNAKLMHKVQKAKKVKEVENADPVEIPDHPF